ncbi:membrane-anchored ubiquitin-fold protein 1 [Staphylotrichum tortipilum]|uniref:Membrane-anchored ubiquitin-fold protein 1 n=1 Tax=Staphylotrichum tortipilum TaxID=2831512 RepID=A0AAN6MT03_9PEZI|nr:membrane-anchored ubiquitin-fold protein 1 [Staphylotrichum longicolle]
MADPAPKADGGPTSNEHQAPSSSIPVNEAGEGAASEQAGDKPAAAGESVAQSSAVAAAGETASKANEGDEATPPAVEKQREGDSLSIGPSDLPPPAISSSNTDAPVCAITLLLPTGARHPYRLDEKYLAKRNVDVPDVTESGGRDPFSISVYKLKELILREWRDEWEGKPASPSSIRLIHFGKLLDDKEHQDSPNVVHMSVRPPEMMEEEETAKGKAHSRDGRSRDGGGGCCVIL